MVEGEWGMVEGEPYPLPDPHSPLPIHKGAKMALPQRDKYIEELKRIEGLMAHAEAHGEREQLEELKARLDRVIRKIS